MRDDPPLPEQQPQAPGDPNPPSRTCKKRWGLILAALVLVLGLAASLLYADYRAFLDTPLGIPAVGMVLEVKPGMSVAGLAQELQRQPGVLRSAWYLQIYARLHRLAHRLKAGEYALAPGTTPRGLLDQIIAGRVIQYTLTVVEGWTFRQLRQAVAAHPRLQQTLSELSDAELMARLGRPGQHPEGWFLPDTYSFPKGHTDELFLRRALDAMERQLGKAWEQRAADLPLREPYQALTLASIVEKETALPQERPDIAGVFTRRLRLGMPLQTDPTVIYGMGEAFDGNLRRADLLKANPYNTYRNKGLPPTPIALPGARALAAVVNPTPGNTLYFVASGDGGHVFSATLAEHNQAVRRYLQRLKRP